MNSAQGFGQMGVRRCLDEERSRLETKMNSIIEKRLSDQKSDEAEMMRIPDAGSFYPDLAVLSHAQKAWFQFRDAECTWQAERNGPGTMRGSTILFCQIKMTRARILILNGNS